MARSGKSAKSARPRTRRASLGRKKANGAGIDYKQQLAESRAQQAATAAILKIINRSPADAQPVFDAIVKQALGLLGGFSSAVFRLEGGLLYLAALTSTNKRGDAALRRFYPRPIAEAHTNGLAIQRRATICVSDTEKHPQARVRAMARARGYRSLIAVPLMRGKEAIGALAVSRRDPGPFSTHEIQLLETLAGQAVVAVENARRFNETKESLEQKTATAEILKVIASTPSDVQPVFDCIVRNASKLCKVPMATVILFDGAMLHLAASILDAKRMRPFAKLWPMPIARAGVQGIVVRERKLASVRDVESDKRVAKWARPLYRSLKIRSGLLVPMIHERKVVGLIAAYSPEPEGFGPGSEALLTTFADQAVIAIENVRLFKALEERNTALTVSLDRQTATGEILSVISRSQTDVQPVFEVIAENVQRLLKTWTAACYRFDGEMLHVGALRSGSAGSEAELRKRFPMRPGVGSLAARCIKNRAPVLAADASADADSGVRDIALERGYRSVLVVPMLRGAEVIGTVNATRREPNAFSQHHVELLQTFAAQAVIAIENVRLFNETKEALERQTATAEILKVIASSPSDVQPVFDAIVASARRLLDGRAALVARRAGEKLELAAYTSISEAADAALRALFPAPITGQGHLGKAVLAGAPVHISDFETDEAYSEKFREMARMRGLRSAVCVPMLREGEPIGVITVNRPVAGKFSEHQTNLLKTFADQAVIAIENVRLFNETKEALERQTATAEILKVIASSPSDVQPVFDAIAASAKRLLNGGAALVARRAGDMLHLAAFTTQGEAADAATKKLWPAKLVGQGHMGKAVLSGGPVLISDIEVEPGYSEAFKAMARTRGLRSVVSVPMLREGEAIGVISVNRPIAGKFSDHQTNLLRTFADQAVIAIENVRLFNETKEALERQTATGEILASMSGSMTDTQPVFDAIARNVARLLDGQNSTVQLLRDGQMHLVGYVGPDPEQFKTYFPHPVASAGVGAMAIREGRVVQLVPIVGNPAASARSQELAKGFDYNAAIAVPLMHDGEAIGALVTARREATPFDDKHVALLQTFASQAVIAIENVRLFNETKESLERQTATSEVLKTISRSTFDLNAVLQVLIENATRLAGANQGFIFRVEGGIARLAYSFNAPPQYRTLIEGTQFAPGRGSLVSRVLLERRTVHLPDALADAEFTLHEAQRAGGFRSMLGVPMLREGNLIGVIAMWTTEVRPFTEKQMELVSTFADQAVIAIENVRLFNETKEALERQTATSEILKVIASSPTDVQPVFDVIVESAVRLCGARFGRLYRYDGTTIQMVAGHGLSTSGLAKVQSVFPRPASDDTIAGRVILARQPLYLRDIERDDTVPELSRQMIKALDTRSQVTIPMLRAGESIGAFTMGWEAPDGFDDQKIALLQTFADQAVIAIENVRLFNETKEALERQTATSEILQVIGSSPTDTQPVFDAIVNSGVRLFPGAMISVARPEGGMVRAAAIAHEDATMVAGWRERFATQLSRDRLHAAAILDARLIDFPDVEAEKDGPLGPGVRNFLKSGNRAVTIMPMLRGEGAIGAISVVRAAPGPLTDKQIAILKTFADQAVIAIENVRLFNETKEALERQTATAEILKVIAGSPSDVQPVFDAIAQAAKRLVSGFSVAVLRLVDGTLHLAALTSTNPAGDDAVRRTFPRPVHTMGVGAIEAAIQTRMPQAHADIQNDSNVEEERRAAARARGFRGSLAVPMLLGGEAVGIINVTRSEAGYFADHQIELLKTFADQAVIAIENVRLFNETKEALERQTATAEILKVISESPTDTRPVFDAIVRAGVRLFEDAAVAVARPVDGATQLMAIAETDKQRAAKWAAAFPSPVSRDYMHGAAVLDCRMVEMPDAEQEQGEFVQGRKNFLETGYRAMTVVPMVREGIAIGTISVVRAAPGPLSDRQQAMLQTFADQAVIAIENVRLFKELQSRTEALTKSVGQLTALGEVGQALSSTLEIDKVLQTVVTRAVQLTSLDGGAIYEYDPAAELYTLKASEKFPEEFVETVRREPIRKGDGVTGRTAVTLEPVQVADILDESYHGSRREILERAGYRAILAVPLLREENLVGALMVMRKSPGEFAPEVIELLRTFAAQSAMAIQNARLFREIADKGKQLEIASRHKSDFLANMSHELRTPLNAIIGFSEVLIERMFGELNEKQADYMKDIHESGRHLLSLINDILDLSKIEAGRMDLDIAAFDLPSSLANAMTLVRERAQRSGIALGLEVDPALGEFRADERKVKQILLNLLSNAVKFTREGGRVDVTAKLQGNAVQIAVKDSGIGIAPEDHAAVFEEFKQVGSDYTRKAEGTGLGLALTKRFVELHGGEIRLESQPGKGSTFTFTLPVRA